MNININYVGEIGNNLFDKSLCLMKTGKELYFSTRVKLDINVTLTFLRFMLHRVARFAHL
jgi:hypothetical protein